MKKTIRLIYDIEFDVSGLEWERTKEVMEEIIEEDVADFLDGDFVMNASGRWREI